MQKTFNGVMANYSSLASSSLAGESKLTEEASKVSQALAKCEARDPRWKSGFQVPLKEESDVLAQMEKGMGQVEGLATTVRETKGFMVSGATLKNHEAAWGGKDGWLTFCEEMNVPPLRVHKEDNPALVQFDTMLFVLFVVWKIGKIKEGGKGRGAEIESAFSYAGRIRAKTAMLKPDYKVKVNMEFIKKQQEALLRQRVEKEGPRKRHRKAAFVLAHFEELRNNSRINWKLEVCELWWTMAETAFSLGWRVGEYTTDEFNKNLDFTLGDVTWARADASEFDPKELMTIGLKEGDRCMVAAVPSKTDRTLEKYADLRFTLIYREKEELVNACRSLANLEKIRQVWGEKERAEAPLFVDATTGNAMTYHTFATMFAYFVKDTFGEELAKEFGTHSFRIGGATTLRMNGMSDDEIMAWGRWSSDAYRRYIRAYTERFAQTGMMMRTDVAKKIDIKSTNMISYVAEVAESLPCLSPSELIRSGTEEEKKALMKGPCQSLDEADLSEEEGDLPTLRKKKDKEVIEKLFCTGGKEQIRKGRGATCGQTRGKKAQRKGAT